MDPCTDILFSFFIREFLLPALYCGLSVVPFGVFLLVDVPLMWVPILSLALGSLIGLTWAHTLYHSTDAVAFIVMALAIWSVVLLVATLGVILGTMVYGRCRRRSVFSKNKML